MLQQTLFLLTTLVGTDPTPGTTGSSEGVVETLANNAQVELNPFGTWLTVITWCALVGINLWCFRRIVRKQPEN